MAQSDDMSCKELVELVTEYFEDALDAGARTRFDAHLGGCPGCLTYLEQIRETVRLTGTLTEEQLDPDARGALLAAFRGWKAQSPST